VAISESAEHLEGTRRLFGVLTMPESAPARRRGILLLNAGSVHRVGPNRLYVGLARRWAAQGHAVLRLDISGIGDSRPRPGQPENVVYTAEASEDIAEALTFLRRQAGVVEVHALGLCSGAYNAFKAAVAGVPLDGVLLINPLTFFFKPGPESTERAELEDSFETSRYARRLRNFEAWKKLFRGEVHVQEVAQVLARRVATLAREHARQVARRAGFRVGDDLPLELNTITKQKVALRFLFAGGDPGIALLHTQGGATVEELERAGKLGIEIIEGPDHTFTPLWSHPVLTAALAAHFDGPPPARR
jgi:hypothetical protein